MCCCCNKMPSSIPQPCSHALCDSCLRWMTSQQKQECPLCAHPWNRPCAAPAPANFGWSSASESPSLQAQADMLASFQNPNRAGSINLGQSSANNVFTPKMLSSSQAPSTAAASATVVSSEPDEDTEERSAPLFNMHGVRSFIGKSFCFVTDPTTDYCIHWSSDGSSFILNDPKRFASQVLPVHFKHSNIMSFTRQLNKYGFRKRGVMEFFHPYFVKGKPQLLKLIRPSATGSRSEPLKHNFNSMKDEAKELKHSLKQEGYGLVTSEPTNFSDLTIHPALTDQKWEEEQQDSSGLWVYVVQEEECGNPFPLAFTETGILCGKLSKLPNGTMSLIPVNSNEMNELKLHIALPAIYGTWKDVQPPKRSPYWLQFSDSKSSRAGSPQSSTSSRSDEPQPHSSNKKRKIAATEEESSDDESNHHTQLPFVDPADNDSLFGMLDELESFVDTL